MRRIQLRLAPAQKAGPSAASTTARTSLRLPTEWKAWVMSAMTSSLKALRTSGWVSVMVARGPWNSRVSAVVFMKYLAARKEGPPSHAEHAEARVLYGSVARGRQAQRQHAARVGRVDDAIVPQARRRVIGVALILVLLADGGLEGLFLLGRSEEHTSELQSPCNLVCRLLLEKKKPSSDR